MELKLRIFNHWFYIRLPNAPASARPIDSVPASGPDFGTWTFLPWCILHATWHVDSDMCVAASCACNGGDMADAFKLEGAATGTG